MRTAAVMMIGAALVLAGCAGRGERPGTPVAIERDSIRYSTGPCFGTCPVYTVTVQPDGSGTFEGQRFTEVTGTRNFTLRPEAYRRFAAALAPYRPASGAVRYAPGEANCRNAPTDMPSAAVTWSSQIGSSEQLSFYYGCAAENRALADALRAAPDLLPIAAFIGRPEDHRR